MATEIATTKYNHIDFLPEDIPAGLWKVPPQQQSMLLTGDHFEYALMKFTGRHDSGKKGGQFGPPPPPPKKKKNIPGFEPEIYRYLRNMEDVFILLWLTWLCLWCGKKHQSCYGWQYSLFIWAKFL